MCKKYIIPISSSHDHTEIDLTQITPQEEKTEIHMEVHQGPTMAKEIIMDMDSTPQKKEGRNPLRNLLKKEIDNKMKEIQGKIGHHPTNKNTKMDMDARRFPRTINLTPLGITKSNIMKTHITMKINKTTTHKGLF